MFKNIERKQRYIDEQQRISQKLQSERDEKARKKREYKKPMDYSIDLHNRYAICFRLLFWFRNRVLTDTFYQSMQKLADESRLEKEIKHVPEKLDEVVDMFLNENSECSNIMNNSDITANISISTQNESFVINKFKQNKGMPIFNDSSNHPKPHDYRIKTNINPQKKPIAININNIEPRDIKLDEIYIKEKFSMLKDKFQIPIKKSKNVVNSPYGESLQNQLSTKSLKKSQSKNKSSTQTSKLSSLLILVDFFHKRHDSNPTNFVKSVKEPNPNDRGWFSNRRVSNDQKSTKSVSLTCLRLI